MNQNTIDYLNAYIGELNAIADQDQVYSTLSHWHLATRQQLTQAIGDLNTFLGLSNNQVLRSHVATTAVGQLRGDVVVISANPGYSPTVNLIEDGYRSHSDENNATFCRNFFHEYPLRCGTRSRYWTAVMRLLEAYREEPRLEATSELWARTSQADALGGLDLLPFHSTSDGITPHLFGTLMQPLLREVASASLAMAIRLSPKFILVASRPGHQLMSDLLTQGDGRGPLGPIDIATVPLPAALAADLPYALIQAWEVSAIAGSTTTVVSIPYQIFSGRLNRKQVGYSPVQFAALLRTLRP